VLEISRSNLINKICRKSERPKLYKKEKDAPLLNMIKEVIDNRPAYGYRRVTALVNSQLKEQGKPLLNHKKIFRIMKQNHLLLSKKPPRPKRSHEGKVETFMSNTRWCSDCFTIQCFNGDKVHVAFSLDTCDREIMRYIASTIGIDGKMIRDLMLETVEYRFSQTKTPYTVQWLSDNGSCFTARETVNFGRELGLDTRTTPPYSPESNGMAEAFVKTFKRDYVWFGDLKDAVTVMGQLEKWFNDYNENAPHKALKMRSPREYLRQEALKKCI
jgi:transposase InsO family protein